MYHVLWDILTTRADISRSTAVWSYGIHPHLQGSHTTTKTDSETITTLLSVFANETVWRTSNNPFVTGGGRVCDYYNNLCDGVDDVLFRKIPVVSAFLLALSHGEQLPFAFSWLHWGLPGTTVRIRETGEITRVVRVIPRGRAFLCLFENGLSITIATNDDWVKSLEKLSLHHARAIESYIGQVTDGVYSLPTSTKCRVWWCGLPPAFPGHVHGPFALVRADARGIIRGIFAHDPRLVVTFAADPKVCLCRVDTKLDVSSAEHVITIARVAPCLLRPGMHPLADVLS